MFPPLDAPAGAERRRRRLGSLPSTGLRARLVWVLLTLGCLVGTSFAQTYYHLPGASSQATGGAIVLEGYGQTYTYVQGLGWLEPIDAPPPLLVDGSVLGTIDLIEALGIDVPVLSDVRFGGDSAVRIVLEVHNLADVSSLGRLAQRGVLEEGDVLALDLPELLVPADPIDPQRGVDLMLLPTPGGTRLELRAGLSSYDVFALDGPPRLVIDVVPQPVSAERVTETREVRPGIRYHRFVAGNGMGLSVVHAVEVAPGAGEIRVVGESHVPRTMSELASGAVVAINAGYFDPADFSAIGLLRVDHELLSLPSRNRAAFAASGRDIAIARVSAEVDVLVDDVPIIVDALEDSVRYVDGFGGLVGAPDKGLLIVVDDVIARNVVGPREVPRGAYALIYDPALRSLARADIGQRAEVRVRLRPRAFQTARYAVEAGPLLVADGRPAFEPDLEAFVRGQRILDAYTQQAGIGIRADGTLLLVAAATMRAEDLIGVFLSLDAHTAMRLDSGGSTALLVDGRAVNSAGNRRIVSAIVVRADAAEAAPATR